MVLIEKAALMKAVERLPFSCGCAVVEREALDELIGGFPEIEAEPVLHGRWIIATDEYGFAKWDQCSVCGHDTKCIGAGTPYCPNCGAKMDLEVLS